MLSPRDYGLTGSDGKSGWLYGLGVLVRVSYTVRRYL